MRELPKICNRIKQDLYNLYKYTQEIIGNAIASLDNQGLLDKFVSKLQRGEYNASTGVYVPNDNVVCTVNSIACKSGNSITIEFDSAVSGGNITFYNGTSFVSAYDIPIGTYTKFKVTVPDDVNAFHFTLYKVGITVETAPKVSVYINNKIEEINDILDSKIIYKDFNVNITPTVNDIYSVDVGQTGYSVMSATLIAGGNSDANIWATSMSYGTLYYSMLKQGYGTNFDLTFRVLYIKD